MFQISLSIYVLNSESEQWICRFEEKYIVNFKKQS